MFNPDLRFCFICEIVLGNHACLPILLYCVAVVVFSQNLQKLQRKADKYTEMYRK